MITAMVARLKADPDVAAIAGQRVYPAPAPEGAALPNITWQQVGDGNHRVAAGVLNVRSTRLQLNVWGDDRLGTMTLEGAVRVSLDDWILEGSVLMAQVVNVVDLIDDSFSPIRYGRALDVQIVHREA
jgi:hypothetical protein